jgi:hypothetical protein
MKIQRVTYGTKLDTRELDHGAYELINPLYANIMIDGEWCECIVPQGFVTDYCSVPRVPFAYMLFGGKYNRTGVLHDALYGNWHQIKLVHSATRYELVITKELADLILHQSLIDEGAWSTTAWVMYQGVNVFGKIFYKRNVLLDITV